MIKELKIYTVICDSCGKDSADGAEYAGWNDKDFSVDCAVDDDWVKHPDGIHHYCPNCYEYNDDDELVILKR
jgi:hypothetical protein